jgi:hypothetical protein
MSAENHRVVKVTPSTRPEHARAETAEKQERILQKAATDRALDRVLNPPAKRLEGVAPREVIEVERSTPQRGIVGVLGRDNLDRSYAGVARTGERVDLWRGPHESASQSKSIRDIEVQRELQNRDRGLER